MFETAESLEGEPIKPGQPFQFACRPGLSCFNSCCRDKRLTIYPYDLLRLRRGLELSSQQVLEQFITLEIDPDSGWPELRIQLMEDGCCPFVKEAGCSIYAHRPTCCRIFPLTRAVAAQGANEIFLATVNTGCLGWEDPRQLTTEQWIEEQGLQPYREANNRISKFFLHPRKARPMTLDSRQMHGVILALYNLDLFRQTVDQPAFAERFGLSPSQIKDALISDEALLELAQDWITAQFFG